VSDALRRKLWVDDDLKKKEREAHALAREALDRENLRAYDCDGLNSGDIAQTVAFVSEVARAEQERETNLNTRGAAVATVAGLIVTVASAVAKSVFEIPKWSDWTKIAAVALFLAALFAVATAMVIAVVAVLRPKRGPRTKNFLGETLVDLWLGQYVAELVGANKDRLSLLSVDRSMRTLPEWHFRNRGKARWLRRSWMLLTAGIVLLAVAAVLVLARILKVTAPRSGGAAEDLTWGWIGLMIGGAAVIAWMAIRFDWVGAGRAVKEDKETERDREELRRIAAKLRVSPLSGAVGDPRGTGAQVPRVSLDRRGRDESPDPAPRNRRMWVFRLKRKRFAGRR
jgi:hypothetical protein